MVATNTDKFKKGARRFTTTVGSGGIPDASAVTVPLSSVTGLPTDTAIEIVVDRVDASGNLTLASEEVITGVISGSNLATCLRGVEGTAQAHSAGAVVEIRLTANQWDDMIDGVIAEHNQDGTHGAITATSIVTDSLEVDGNDIYSGWSNSSSVWTYTSWDVTVRTGVVATASDESGNIQLGDRITFSQSTGGTKYAIVTAITSSAITLFMYDTDVLENEAITSPQFSHQDNPFGFDKDSTKWLLENIITTNQQTGGPVAGTWYNKGGSLQIGIGKWDVEYSGNLQGDNATAVAMYLAATLSTANNSQSDASNATGFANGNVLLARAGIYKRISLTLTVADTYYFNIQTATGISNIYTIGTAQETIIRATCVYL